MKKVLAIMITMCVYNVTTGKAKEERTPKMFTVTFNRETEIFETTDYDNEKRIAGKCFDESYVMSYELWGEEEDDYMIPLLDEVTYSMSDWERDND